MLISALAHGISQKDEEKFFGERIKLLNDYGLTPSQAHAPYFSHLSDDPTEFTDGTFKNKIITAIRRAAIIGAPYLVLHLYVPYVKNKEVVPYDYSIFAEDNFKRNVEFCEGLKPYLREYGVSIALENLNAYDCTTHRHASTVCCTSKECNRYIDTLGDEYFCICLDTGHLNLVAGETHDEFITNLHGRVKVLHLNDNFGIWELDRHLSPFIGCLEWDKLAASLKKNDFNGVYSFEMKSYMPNEFIDDYYSYLYKAGKKIFY